MRCFLQCASPGIVASSEDCRKFWLCKEEEEGSRVLEVRIWKKNYLNLPSAPSHSYLAVSVIPVSPRLPIQHSDCPMCKARRGLLSSGPTSRGRLQVNFFFSTHQTWLFLQHVCKYFAAGAWPPSSWVSTSLTPSLLAGLKNNAGLKNLLHSVCSAMSSIHVLPQSILSHYSATFVVLSDHALFCHICYQTVTDWLSHHYHSNLPISNSTWHQCCKFQPAIIEQWLHLS